MWYLIKHYAILLWEQLFIKPNHPDWYKKYKFTEEDTKGQKGE